MLPRRACDEQQRERDHDVDEARAEVGLGDHEHRRHQRSEHHQRGRVAIAQAPGAIDDERGQRDGQQYLAELGGLEGEERQADRALRAARGVAEPEYREDAQDQCAVDHVFQRSQARVVQPRERQHQQHADDQVARLAIDVVVRLAGDEVFRRRAERHDRAHTEADRSEREQRVERQAQRPRTARRRRDGLLGRRDRAQRAQNVFELPATNFSG